MNPVRQSFKSKETEMGVDGKITFETQLKWEFDDKLASGL